MKVYDDNGQQVKPPRRDDEPRRDDGPQDTQQEKTVDLGELLAGEE